MRIERVSESVDQLAVFVDVGDGIVIFVIGRRLIIMPQGEVVGISVIDRAADKVGSVYRRAGVEGDFQIKVISKTGVVCKYDINILTFL